MLPQCTHTWQCFTEDPEKGDSPNLSFLQNDFERQLKHTYVCVLQVNAPRLHIQNLIKWYTLLSDPSVVNEV